MMRLALGGKWGLRGASGLAGPAAARAVLVRREESTMEPRPTPHSLKNQRRAWSFRVSTAISCLRFMTSILGHGFVEVQEHAGDDGPGGGVRWGGAGWDFGGFGRVAGGDFS